jgi:hypothetical protein
MTALNWEWFGPNYGIPDASSEIGYSTLVGNSSYLIAVNGSTNLTGGVLYEAKPSILKIHTQAPAVISDTLGAAQLAGDTTLTITTPTTSVWGSSGYIQVDQEIEEYTGVTSGLTTINVTRGLGATLWTTLAVAHNNGDPYTTIGTGYMQVGCDGTHLVAQFPVSFTPTWTWYDGTFVAQNCNSLPTHFSFLVSNTGPPTGQTYKIDAMQIMQNPILPTPTAKNEVAYSTFDGASNSQVFDFNAYLPLTGAPGAGIVTGPITSVNGDCASFTGTLGQIQDSGNPCGTGNIAGGVLGSVPYQSAPSTTSLVAPNTSTSILCFTEQGTGSAGAAPVWGSCAGSAATAFSALTSSTNTSAAMLVGTGASLGVAG